MLRQVSSFLLFMLLLAFAGGATAQDYYSSTYQYKPISLGITFSPSMAWMRYSETDEYEGSAKLSYAYGLLADFAFSENYYFSSGLLINTLNAESKGPIGTNSPNRDYRIQYAEIPLALKLKSTQRYFRSYYGLFGFTAGFKLSAKEKIQGNPNRTTLGDNADLLRLALQIGGGVEWQLDHNLVMMTGLSFNNGLTRAIDIGEPKNSYAAFNFAIFF